MRLIDADVLMIAVERTSRAFVCTMFLQVRLFLILSAL